MSNEGGGPSAAGAAGTTSSSSSSGSPPQQQTSAAASSSSDVQSLRDLQRQRWLQQKQAGTNAAASNDLLPGNKKKDGAPASSDPGQRATSSTSTTSRGPGGGSSSSTPMQPTATLATRNNSTTSSGSPPPRPPGGTGSSTGGGSSSSSAPGGRSPSAGRSPVRPLRTLVAPDVGSGAPQPKEIRKIHILPLGVQSREQQRLLGSGDVLQFLKPCLSAFRTNRRLLYTGMVFEHGGCDFIVVKTDPENGKEAGVLCSDTEYYFTGPPVARFKRIQFSALTCVLKRGPEVASTSANLVSMVEDEDLKALTTEQLFQDLIAPYFQDHSDNEKTGGVFKLLNVNETITINGVQFVVMATDPESSYGIVDKDTLIYVDKDETPEYRRIHIVPFQDTLPRSYEYDVFNDYLKPYCKAHANQRYRVNDVFTYNAVQFKVVCCDPEELGGTNSTPGSGGRIGRNTTVYCEGVLHPQLRDLLPPELVAQLAYLPPGLQMLLLSTDAVGGNQELFERLMEVQDMLQQRRGMNEETIANVEKITIDKEQLEDDDGQHTCMVCLCDFEEGDEARRLPCNHTFHAGCIDEWLRRSCECPICKHNVDRTIRNY